MTYRKSALPYLFLLITLIIGVPLVNHYVAKDQTIHIEIQEKSTTKQPSPLAFK